MLVNLRYALVGCALAAFTVSCAQPTPTPDIQATVDAAVRAALAAQAPPTPTFTPSPILTADEAKDFLESHLSMCVYAMDLIQVQTEASYVGGGVWLVKLDAFNGPNTAFPVSPGQPWRAGRWRLDELTGDLQPYDPSARLVPDVLEVCQSLVVRSQ